MNTIPLDVIRGGGSIMVMVVSTSYEISSGQGGEGIAK